MKKRVMIYVDSSDWVEVRKRCIDLGISTGDYLIGLHKGSGVVINPEMVTREIPGKPVEISTGQIDKILPLSSAGEVDQDWRDQRRAIPKK